MENSFHKVLGKLKKEIIITGAIAQIMNSVRSKILMSHVSIWNISVF